MDGDAKRISAKQMTYIPTVIWQTAISAFLLLSSALPTSAHAGVFSSIIATISNQIHGVSTQQDANSQTIALLSAANNIDPNPSKGGGDITITDSSALVASNGPSGTLADVEDSKQASSKSKHTGLYVVRNGDTLSEIANMFDVSVNTIRWANDIGRRGTIHPGQELIILPMTGIKYKVKHGGTLRDIIKSYGGDIDEAVEYNDIDADKWLAKGTEVFIPDAELQVKEPVNSWRAKRKYSRTIVRARTRGASAPYYKGYYIRPVVGGVKTQGLHGYNAIDIGIPLRTPVMAAAPGRIIRAKYSGWNSGYGNYVMIQHPNGTQTLYAHNTEVIVHVGQIVKQGQIIAYSGTTGNSTGPHLHFEIRGARNPF